MLGASLRHCHARKKKKKKKKKKHTHKQTTKKTEFTILILPLGNLIAVTYSSKNWDEIYEWEYYVNFNLSGDRPGFHDLSSF